MGLEDSDVWINLSQSGNGFLIRVDGETYVGSMKSLRRFLDGEIKGINLSKQVAE